MKTALAIVLAIATVTGCSGFSTHPPEIPRSVVVSDESFEKDYVVRKLGSPTTVDIVELGDDLSMELWLYGDRGLLVVFVVDGTHYRVLTYGRPTPSAHTTF